MNLSVRIKQKLGDFSLDVAFDAPPGVTALFGASGSGKSSIIKAIAGLNRPDQGQIICNGRVLFDHAAGTNLPAHKRRLGVIFQEGRLFPHLTVQQNLNYGRWFAARRTDGPAIADVIALLGIGHLLHRRPYALSGGERQRVAIGRALLSSPDMILADEPLSALDEARRAEILPYFEALRDAAIIPILYVSHSIIEVARLANHVISLDAGRVLATGSAAQVLGRIDAQGGAVSVLTARFLCQARDGLCTFSTEFGPVLVPNFVNADVAKVTQLRIDASDVIIASAPPTHISALNILAGTVTAMTAQQGGGMMVSLAQGQGQILARITHRSASALGLAVGQPAFAIIKTIALGRESSS